MTPQEKKLALECKPVGSKMVYVGNYHVDRWAAIWFDENEPSRHHKWQGQLFKEIKENGAVWWTGEVYTASTRKAVISLLIEEAGR